MVPTENVAVLEPGATVTASGVLATEGALLESDTTAPFTGALLSTMVPRAGLPLATLAGFKTTDATVIPEELDGVTLTNVLFCAVAP